MFEWSSALKPFHGFEMLTVLSHSSIVAVPQISCRYQLSIITFLSGDDSGLGFARGVMRALCPPSAAATMRYSPLVHVEYMTFAWLHQIPVPHISQDCANAVMTEAGELSIRVTFRPSLERHA